MSWKCQCVRARPACAREEMAPRATFFFPLSSTWREIEWALSLPSAKCGCMCEMERRSIRKFSQQRFHLLASIREKQVPLSSCFWRTFFCLPSKIGSSYHAPKSDLYWWTLVELPHLQIWNWIFKISEDMKWISSWLMTLTFSNKMKTDI